ncbi:MAG TPA: AsmA-like C-terminal region-containing protein [Steroidobacteraceae bacterium]|nr:AsmA-like C-terminal region-containing protein [Steroidobacteraceae bacterium]
MSRARRIWKWSAATFGVLVVLLAVGVGALRLWLEHTPGIGPEIVARVQKLTGLEFSFVHLDARLGLYGPELVFGAARVTVPGQHDALVTARAGRVGFDLWRSLRTGRLASARVVLEGAHVFLYLTDTGVELRGQGAPSAAEGGAHLALGELPVGRVRIEDATVLVQDLRHGARPFRFDRVALDLERNPDSLQLSGRVQLPPALGTRLDLDARLKGDLAALEALDWQADVALRGALIGGWSALAPEWSWLPVGGHGDVKVSATGHGADLAALEAHLALHEIVTPADGATPASHLATLGAQISVQHSGGRWLVAGRELNIDPGHDAWQGGEFDVTAEVSDGALRALELRSPAIRLDALAALAPLVPPGGAREAGLALAPRGALTVVDLRARHGEAAGEWHVDGGLRFTGLGFGAWHTIPGLTGLDGNLSAEGDSGKVRLHSDRFTLNLATALRETVGADSVGATLSWWWRPDGWRFAADEVRTRSPDATTSGSARLWLPSDPEESPRLVLDFAAENVDARVASKYLPGRAIPPKTMEWLDHAFVGGHVPKARIEFAGETRRFPFRDGGGLFRVSLHFDNIRLHYQDRFADIENATGDAEFKNQGFSVHGSSARIAGLTVSEPYVEMKDYRDAELLARARGEGDVADALHYLQSSPVGPKLGEFFMKLSGHGPFDAHVDLDFPFRQFAQRRINIDGHVDNATVKLPGFDELVTDLSGAFALHDRELNVPQLTGSVLDGPLKLRARTITGPTGLAGDRVLVVEGSGRASGARVQPALGITRGRWLTGATDWKVQARLPRLEWRAPAEPPPADAPADAPPLIHEVEIRSLPVAVHLESGLEGLEVNLPEPLAKDADEARALKVDLTVDPGLAADAPRPPPAFKRRDLARPPSIVARLALGADSGALEWRHEEDWRLARGTLHLGAGNAQLRDTPGVWIEGRTDEYDLSAWLRVKLSEGSGHGLSEVLKGGTVAVNRFGIFGFEFPDVTLTLESRGAAWHAAVDGPSARGQIVVPWELPGGDPLTLDMERLVLGERTPAGDGSAEESDPTQLPAMSIRVKSLEIQKRRFGSLEAHISRTAEGLQLDNATLKGNSFEASARGSWSLAGTGQATTVSLTLDSTDLLDTLNAWGFAPTLTGKAGHATADLHWRGGIDDDVFSRLAGKAQISVEHGQVMSVDPGAGRVLGLLSVAALPRRLTLDFRDLTDKGFSFDSIHGDFEFKDGSAYTNDLVLKGPAAEIGIVGRTGLKARDYDQTAKVTGHFGGPVAAVGALAAGPAVGAALLLFSTVFKEPLSGLTRGYYRITGSWDQPKVERIGASQAKEAAESATAEGGAR